jgi:hypothetical protein
MQGALLRRIFDATVPNPNMGLLVKEHSVTGVWQPRLFATEVGRWFDERVVARARSRTNAVGLIYQSRALQRPFWGLQVRPNAMREHWQSSLDDRRRTLRLDRPTPELCIVTHDVHRK